MQIKVLESIYQRGLGGECLPGWSQGDCHTRPPPLAQNKHTPLKLVGRDGWRGFTALIYPVPPPLRAKAGKMCAWKQERRPQSSDSTCTGHLPFQDHSQLPNRSKEEEEA